MSPTAIGQPQRFAYKQLFPRSLLWVIANVLLIGLIVGSFLPSEQKIRIGTQRHQDPRSGTLVTKEHRLYHFGSFGLTTLAFLLLAKSIRGETVAVAAMFAVGCAIETTQCLMVQDHLLEWWDIRDDGYAIAGAFLVIQIANAVFSKWSSNQMGPKAEA